MEKRTKEILDFYDAAHGGYRRFWDLEKSHAIRIGYWDEKVRTLRDALRREDEIIAQLVGIQKGMRVLDAGCGVGASCLYLASLGCSVDGVNIQPNQIEEARRAAAPLPVQQRPRFHLMDFTEMAFLDDTFDAVVAVESLCHASNREDFLKEAYRVLKPGGKLAVADRFLKQEGEGLDKVTAGWHLAPFPLLAGFKVSLKKTGFEFLEAVDATDHVVPSSKRLYRLGSFFYWPMRLMRWLNWISEERLMPLEAAVWHHKTLEAGLWGYYIVVCQKPPL